MAGRGGIPQMGPAFFPVVQAAWRRSDVVSGSYCGKPTPVLRNKPVGVAQESDVSCARFFGVMCIRCCSLTVRHI